MVRNYMKEIKLFEIPIYSMKRVEYEKRCFNYINKHANETSQGNYKNFYTYLENIYYRKRPWKYNQVVGYIVISYRDSSIWFDKFCTPDKKIHAIADKKHIIQNMQLNGYHFYLSKKMNNEDVRKEIINWVGSIEKYVLNKPFFLDKEMFLLQLEFIDIKRMIG